MKNYSNETKQSELKTDEEWYKEILEFIAPDTEHWVVIVLIIFTFLLGIGGNLLVCLAVWRNRNLRTLTNIHLVNLAVADFLVIAVCLPPTLLQDAMESWFLGTIGCKIVIYLQVRTPFFDDFFFFLHFLEYSYPRRQETDYLFISVSLSSRSQMLLYEIDSMYNIAIFIWTFALI